MDGGLMKSMGYMMGLENGNAPYDLCWVNGGGAGP